MSGTSADRNAVLVPGRVRLTLVLFGLVAVVAGAIAMYRGEDGAASAAIITVGMALVALGLLTPYFRSFKAGGVEIELLQQRVEETQSALRELVADVVGPLGAGYELIRDHVPAGSDRTELLYAYNDLMVSSYERISEQAQVGEFTPSEVAKLFRTHGDGGRIGALALMSRAPELASVDCLVDAIGSSRSAFEQFRALNTARAVMPDLSVDEEIEILEAVERGRSRYSISSDSSRLVAERQLWGAASRAAKEECPALATSVEKPEVAG